MHTDHQYIEALRHNDPKGIRSIYERYAVEALKWVKNNNGTADDARDVFQEAVSILFEKAQNPNFVLTCPVGALLYTLYSRRWIDHLRTKKREYTVRLVEETRYNQETTSDVLSIAEVAEEEAVEQRRIAQAFAQLSEVCRRLFALLAEGIAPKEAASQLEMNSVDTLYRRKNACATRWRELLG